MAYITKFGGFWGMLPQTSGRIFWVAPSATYTVEGRTYAASDGNDGLSPERAFRTVDYAVGQTTANVGDVLVLLPGSHSVSATGFGRTPHLRRAHAAPAVGNHRKRERWGPAREYTR